LEEILLQSLLGLLGADEELEFRDEDDDVEDEVDLPFDVVERLNPPDLNPPDLLELFDLF
jgi:hypothetical protein